MKLYSLDMSSYAARVRLAIYAKGLPVEIVPPPGGLKSDEFRAISPTGKVPTLLLENGAALPESATIMEYLADVFPEAELRPQGAEAAAHARLLARIADTYLMGGGSIIAQVPPATRNQAVVDAAMAVKLAGMGYLEKLIGDAPYACGEALTDADCALAPALCLLELYGPVFGVDAFAVHPRAAAYRTRLGRDPSVRKVTGEMRTRFQTIVANGL